MEPAQLIKECIRVIKAFDPTVSTVDVHLIQALGADYKGAGASPDKVFVSQVFYGVQRHDKTLRVALNALYHVHAAEVNRADYTMYEVLMYLALFKLEEMGIAKFTMLLDSQDASKMHVLLRFLWNTEEMREWVIEGWCKFLDRSYVENTVLAGMERQRAGLEAWMTATHAKAFGFSNAAAAAKAQDGNGSLGKATKKPPTVPVAPKLTAPKPRTAPEPERIPQYVKAAPVPEWIEATTLEQIEAEAAARKEAVKAQTSSKYDPAKDVPKLHETKRNIDRVRAEVEAERDAELRPEGIKPRPPPPLSPTGADVRLNVAAILREDAVFKAKQAAEAALIRDFEWTLRDSSEYTAWQEDARRKDEAARKAAVELRRQEAAEAAVKAAAAHAYHEARNAEIARAMKEAGRVVLEHKAVEAQGQVDMKRGVVDQIKAVEYVNPDKAKAAVVMSKKVTHDALRERTLQEEAALAAQRAEEALEKKEVIRQIRALIRVPKPHVKTFDPAEAANNGLLDAMSLVELRERLQILKAREAEAVDEKRRAILRDKREKEETLKAKVVALQARRAQAWEMNRSSRAASADAAERTARAESAERDTHIQALAEQLAARRAAREEERKRVEADRKRTQKAQLFLGLAAAATEEKRLEQRMDGMERRSKQVQGVALRQQAERDAVRVADERAAAVRQAELDAAALAASRAKALEVARATREEQSFRLLETARKKGLFFEATAREEALRDMRDASNQYGANVRNAEADTARSLRGGIPRDVQHEMTLSKRLQRLPANHPLATAVQQRIEGSTARRAEREEHEKLTHASASFY